MPRLRRRLKIKLGGSQTFTADVSATGFAAELMHTLKPGTMQHGSIEIADQKFDFTGQVCWAKAAEPRMDIRSRFGIRFTGIPEAFFKLLAEAFHPQYVAG